MNLPLIIIPIAMALIAWHVPPGWNALIVMLLMVVFMLLLGAAVSKRPLGILINQRNLMSLSRFQAVLWTLVVLAGYFTMALMRVKAWLSNPSIVPDPVAIQIDGQIWALLGISGASLIGSPLLASAKSAKEPDQAAVTKIANTFTQSVNEVNDHREGILYGNPSMNDARLADMFQGDEIADTSHIDLTKVQMFLFTLVAIICYAVMLFQQIHTNTETALKEFPKVSPGLIALLGISHAGYLGNKAIDKTKVQ